LFSLLSHATLTVGSGVHEYLEGGVPCVVLLPNACC